MDLLFIKIMKVDDKMVSKYQKVKTNNWWMEYLVVGIIAIGVSIHTGLINITSSEANSFNLIRTELAKFKEINQREHEKIKTKLSEGKVKFNENDERLKRLERILISMNKDQQKILLFIGRLQGAQQKRPGDNNGVYNCE